MQNNGFSLFWLKFFDLKNTNTPEAVIRSFIASSIYNSVKKRHLSAHRKILQETSKDALTILATNRYRHKFPQERINEQLNQLNDEKLFARRAKDERGLGIMKSEYRVALHRIKTMKKREKQFYQLHKSLKGRLRSPNYLNSIHLLLSSEEGQKSHISRLATLFVIGYWFYRLNITSKNLSNVTLSDLLRSYFDNNVTFLFVDKYEKIIVKEAITCFSQILLAFGEYINRFYEDCMFCNFHEQKKGVTELDFPLMYLFPGIKMTNWLRFKSSSTILAELRSHLLKIFPFDSNPTIDNPSSRRIIGVSARKKVRYQALAKTLVKIMKLDSMQNKPPYYHFFYLDSVAKLVLPYIINFSRLNYSATTS